MAKLIIEIDVDVDPALEDPHEIAWYALDEDADDPVVTFVDARWKDDPNGH